MNIEGKRSGKGFVAHKRALIAGLSRVLAERLMFLDSEYGRKGFLAYVKSLSGSIVKVIPASDTDSASDSQADRKRGMRVICGNHTAVIPSGAWIGDKTSITLAEIRVSPHNVVVPNIGATELAEAIGKVLPFTANEDNRPVLQCVYFVAKEGKLTLASADGHRLATTTVDLETVEGEALIHRDDLKGMASALKLARRARVGFETRGDSLTDKVMVIATELITYKLNSRDGTFPDYEKLIPTDFKAIASFDSIGTAKAIASIKALSDNPKAYHVDLAISNGKVTLGMGDAEAEIPADTEGDGHISIDGRFLTDALKACGTLADFKVVNATSPAVFATNGLRIVTMPVAGKWAIEDDRQAKAEAEASQPVEPVETTEPVQPEATTEPTEAGEPETTEPEASDKPKRKRKRELAGVA